MKLTGKCKEEFNKWYFKTVRGNEENLLGATNAEWFYLLTKSMQYGVFEDYFDSVGVRVFINEEFDTMGQYQRGFNPVVNNVKLYKDNDCFHTRPEARIAAIEKANELRNEVLNK
tara:strand:- start:77 stop:421 length:345 start_codon:yes stop_codon:yes gene_type:complete